MTYKPPFQINSTILKLSQEIARELGAISGTKLDFAPIKLRKINNIKTVQASLAIEGNTLSIGQVSDVFDGKRVLGPKKDIMEVKNAIEVYKNLSILNPLSYQDMLKAHAILMNGLVLSAGKWRTGGVGIFKGKEVAHLPPPAKRVPVLMQELFNFLSEENDITWILKACIFHYELEFIHPFEDGNGRIGRLWQQLVLMKEDPVFEYISVEELIKEKQQEYYAVLGECDRAGDSTEFIEFSMLQILNALKSYNKPENINKLDAESRLHYAMNKLHNSWFSRKDYALVHSDISSATASRDLLFGIKNKILDKKGEKNQAVYKFKSR